MRFTFLGTGHGYAEKDRACSSTLIELASSAYLLDAGLEVDFALEKLGKDRCCMNAVFLTHMHEDHAGGLTSAFKGYDWRNKLDDITIYFPEQEGLDGFKTWTSALHWNPLPEHYEGFQLVREGTFFNDGHLRVTAILTDHMPNMRSYAYVFEAEDKRVGFTGDLSGNGDFHDFPKCFTERPFDLIVCEMAHFKTESAIEKINQCKTKQLIFHHVTSEKLKEAQPYFKQLPFDVLVAYDGCVFEL